MGFAEWRAKRRIKDPVRGVFRRSEFYDRGGTTWLTGTITAPGMLAFVAEVKADGGGKWADHEELPCVVDRTNPNNVAILWEDVVKQGPGAQALQAAQEDAARLNAAAPGGQPVAGTPPAGYGTPSAGDAPPAGFATPPAGFGSLPTGMPATPTPAGFTGDAGQSEMADWARSMAQQPATGAPPLGATSAQVFVNGQAVPGGEHSPLVAEAMRLAAQALQQQAGAMPIAPTGAIATTATITAANDFPAPIPGGGANLTFDVQMPDGSHRTATAHATFTTPERRARFGTVGATLAALYDPTTGWLRPDPSRQV